MLDRFDYVHLRDVTTILPIEPDAWRRPEALQLANLSIKIGYPTILLHAAARNDALDCALNYSQLYRSVSSRIGEQITAQNYMKIEELGTILMQTCVAEVRDCITSKAARDTIGDNEIAPLPLELSIRLDKGILRAENGVTYHFTCSHKFPGNKGAKPHVKVRQVEVSNIKSYCIIGVNDCEREDRQQVAVSYKLENCRPQLKDLQELTKKMGQVSTVTARLRLDGDLVTEAHFVLSRPSKSIAQASKRWKR